MERKSGSYESIGVNGAILVPNYWVALILFSGNPIVAAWPVMVTIGAGQFSGVRVIRCVELDAQKPAPHVSFEGKTAFGIDPLWLNYSGLIELRPIFVRKWLFSALPNYLINCLQD